MDPNLPTAMNFHASPDRIRQDLFDRLHWNVFGPLGDISVRDGTTLTPFTDHAIGSESIADPPVARIAVQINACQEKYSMDETEEEKYRYQSPAPLVIEKFDGAPILLSDFVAQVHLFLNANKEEIYKCEDEIYTQPTELEDGWKFVGVDPDEFDSFEDEDESAEPSHFWRSGNIPADSRFFFDQAQFNAVDTDEFEAYITFFVEGNMGTSFEQFWERRAGV
ncbi:hypothetical protein W97_01883 [Coniosporium apollinis CBS 100218]|uniref:Uncharacterized protein n=1 Tax=Coniosporium apollinis (strain CBS 100218) TaxID=1168221 RepID=R7YLI2_CONA1|nr:uncharacterized protein W97_01883 [Coniosporium apollinis CBS 100218]EON62659.1 hypothetical protein W97_01883 [Coniosporium apollinis CBS 100218]